MTLRLRPLSPRQAEIMTLRAAGRSYKEIAHELSISTSCVGNMLTRAGAKGYDVPRTPRRWERGGWRTAS